MSSQEESTSRVSMLDSYEPTWCSFSLAGSWLAICRPELNRLSRTLTLFPVMGRATMRAAVTSTCKRTNCVGWSVLCLQQYRR